MVSALAALFCDLSTAEADWQSKGERRIVDPTALREALGDINSQLYRFAAAPLRMGRGFACAVCLGDPSKLLCSLLFASPKGIPACWPAWRLPVCICKPRLNGVYVCCCSENNHSTNDHGNSMKNYCAGESRKNRHWNGSSLLFSQTSELYSRVCAF